MAVDFDDMSGGFIRVAAVEIAVAAAGGALEGGGVGRSGSRRRHELPATVQGVPT